MKVQLRTVKELREFLEPFMDECEITTLDAEYICDLDNGSWIYFRTTMGKYFKEEHSKK